MSKVHIHWVLTHDPIALFEEAARRFQRSVHELSDGAIEVTVSTPVEYGGGVRVPAAKVMEQVADGTLQMSQTYSTVLGRLHRRLWTLDLPFLFESHEHAATVLDGEVGRELLDGLRDHRLHGLAFTYSGGYRIISSTGRAIQRLEDFEGLEVRTAENPVVTSLFELLGAHPHPAPLQAIPELTAAGTIEAGESTWPRYWDMQGHPEAQPVVNETSHSLFLTSLVVNAAFFDALSPHLQRVMQIAALDTAQHERHKSVRDGLESRAACIARGGVVNTLTRAESQRLERAAAPVYDQFTPEFGSELIDRIRKQAFAASA